MKFKELPTEQQEHFLKVVKYCEGNNLMKQLEEATHIDFNCCILSLTKFVDDVEYFYNNRWTDVIGGSTSLLYQKPDKPWYDPEDVSFKDAKLKPQDLKCFKEVAGVIGHEEAVKELQVMLDTVTPERLDADRYLSDAFYWDDTPQGYAFWDCLWKNDVPEPYKSPSDEKKESDSTLEETSKRVADELVEQIKLETHVNTDMVAKPSHYQLLPEYEVKDVMKALLDKVEASDFDMSYYEAGWFQQAMQYFLRFHGKNGLEDLEKGLQTMQFVVDSLKERNGND